LSAVLTTFATLLTTLTTRFLLLLARLQPSVALLPVLALIAALTTLMLAILIVLVDHEFLLKPKGLPAPRITSYSHASSKITLFARDLGVLSS
jgi:hypothetical protein